MVRALIVIPTYEEAGNIVDVLRRVRAAAPVADVLVVDDGSPDGTAELADAVGRELGQITVMRRAGKAGLGSAYRAGFRWGLDHGYDALIEMDADLSHDPAVVPDLLARLADGADLAIGSRYVPGGSIPNWTAWRRALSRWGNRYAAWALGLDVADATAGFRAYRADALADIDFESVRADGYGFQIETAYRMARHGRKIAELPICFVDRREGESKMSMRIIAEALLLVTGWGARDRVVALTRRR